LGDKKKTPIPHFHTGIIETHCHLDYLKQKECVEIVEMAHSVGVEKMITISVSSENLDQIPALTKQFDEVYCTQGLHPHNAIEWNEDVKSRIIHNLEEDCKNNKKKIVAIGEIGLDYYYNKSPKEIQIKAFEEQIELASKYDLPIVIHSRDADEDMISILKNSSHLLKRKGVVHSFTSGEALAREAMALGFYIGFNGIITFKNAQNVRDVVAITPLDKILLETDSPFLTPIPYRGVENAPFYLPFVAAYLSEFLGIEVEQMLKQIKQNSIDLFSFS
jgi:TatD DNase family protein